MVEPPGVARVHGDRLLEERSAAIARAREDQEVAGRTRSGVELERHLELSDKRLAPLDGAISSQ